MSKTTIIGYLGHDAREVKANGKTFLSARVGYKGYDKEAREEVTRWVEVRITSYGPGLLQYLTTGAAIAAVGTPGTSTYTKDGQEHTVETLEDARISIGKSMFETYSNGDNTMAAVVGRIGAKGAAEVTVEGKPTFLGFSVATDVYNRETRTTETVWLDATLNHYGAGLVPLLVKGKGVALVGILLPAKEEGKPQRLLVNSLHLFGNKKSEDQAPAQAMAEASAGEDDPI